MDTHAVFMISSVSTDLSIDLNYHSFVLPTMEVWVRTVKASVVFASIFPTSNSGEASCKNPNMGCKSDDINTNVFVI